MICDNRKIHWFSHTWAPVGGRGYDVAVCGEWGKNGDQIKRAQKPEDVTCKRCHKMLDSAPGR